MCRVRRVDYSSRTGSHQAWQALFYQPTTEHKARLRGRSTRRSVNKAYRSGPLAWQRPGFPWVIGLGTASQQRLPSSFDNSHFSTQDHLHRRESTGEGENARTHSLLMWPARHLAPMSGQQQCDCWVKCVKGEVPSGQLQKKAPINPLTKQLTDLVCFCIR